MTRHLPFTIYHLPLISHSSFFKQPTSLNCKLLIDNLLKIENCKLKIEPTLGGVS